MMQLVLHIAVFTATLLAIHEALCRVKWLGYPVFLLVPLALLPHWLSSNSQDVFYWAKTASVLAGMLWATALRTTPLGQRRWALSLVYALLALNIGEAVVWDLFVGRTLPHVLDALAGFLLVVTLAKADSIVIDSADGRAELHWKDMRVSWILGYTAWNAVFIYLNYPRFLGSHIAVLGAALIVGVVKPQRWIFARASTLAVFLMFPLTSPWIAEGARDTSLWRNGPAEILLASASLLFVTAVAARHFSRKIIR